MSWATVSKTNACEADQPRGRSIFPTLLCDCRLLGAQRPVERSPDHTLARSWVRNVEHATWHSIADVRRLYPATDGGVRMTDGKLVTVFNVKGNEYRLISDVIYAAQVVVVLELMTHADYSKGNWKKRKYP